MFNETMKGSEVEIVSLPIENWRKYKEIRLRALEKEPQAFEETYAQASDVRDEKWQQSLQRAIDGRDWLLFARMGVKLVGMIGAYQDEEDRQNMSAHVWGMYVDPEVRAQGIARRLLTYLIQVLRDNNVLTAKLDVNADQEPAKRLYESLGFKVVSVEARTLGDGQEHQVLAMELVIK